MLYFLLESSRKFTQFALNPVGWDREQTMKANN